MNKKWKINPIYFPGTDFKILKSGKIVNRKPTKKDIEYYEIIEPDGSVLWREFTIAECKKAIKYAGEKFYGQRNI